MNARVVNLTAPGFSLAVFVGDKPSYLGINSKKLLAIRKGYSLVSIDENDKAVPADDTGTPSASEGPAPAEEISTPSASEGPAPAEDHPPLPE